MVPSSFLGNKGARVGQKECNMPVQDPRPATEAAAAVLEEASRAQAQAKAKVTTPALLQRNNSMGEFPVDHGTINFIVHRIPSNPEFVKCRPTANKQLLVHHAWEKWGLEPYPGVLARVIGSIDGVADDKRGTLEDVVEGLIKAAHIAKGWLFSTGLDFGMAHMVGGLVARNRHVCESPLIGVAAWRTVQNKEQLEKNTKGLSARKGDKRVYADAKPSDDMDKISLQPNHTHFMLLGVAEGEDDPMDPPPGMSKEDALLAARKKSFKFAHDFEHEIRVVQAESGLNDLSQRMLFVVHGDETTLEEITTFCELGEGFVLLAAQTGGVAEAIASYVESGKASGQYTVPIGWKHAAGRFERLKELNAKKRVELQAMSTERRSGSLVAIAAGEWPMLEISQAQNSKEMQKSILDCILNQESSPVVRIMNAVRWDDDKRLQRELSFYPTWHQNRSGVLRDALQLALELENTNAVRVCVENAAPVKEINLLALYDKLYDGTSLYTLVKGKLPTYRRRVALGQEDPHSPVKGARRPSSEQTPASKMQQLSKETPSQPLLAAQDSTQPSKVDPYGERGTPEEDPIFDYYAIEIWRLLQDVVPGLTLYWKAKVKGLIEKQDAPATPGAKPPGKLGARWIDIYVWAVLLGNTELALMLLPACQEPMRAAIIGARLCAYMATKLPLHRNMLTDAAKEHESFATNLLDLCDTFEDARRMLTTKSRHWNRTVVQLGLQSGLRDFIAHMYCQTLCDQWYMGNTDPVEKEAILASNEPPGPLGFVTIILAAIVPIKIPGLPSMIKWDNDHGGADDLTDPPMLQLYRIPAVKSILRLTMHVLYTVFFSYAIMETTTNHELPEDWSHLEFHEGNGIEKPWIDLVLWIWTIALAFDEYYKYNCDPATFTMGFWNRYDYSVISITFVGLVLRMYSVKLATEIMAFNVILIWCRLFKYLAINYALGVLVIMIMEMFKDIALWTLVSLVFLGGFTVAFVAISDPLVLHDSMDHPLTVPLWAMHGAFDVHEVKTWNPTFGAPLLWLYVIVAQVILVNLLIAMMGDTYSIIKERADEEWKFGRLVSVMESTERHHRIPPPFNLPITMMDFIHSQCKNTIFGKLCPSYGDGPKPYDYATNKKLKGKVARALMLKYKKQQEEARTITLDGYAEQLTENQVEIKSEIHEVQESVANIKRILDKAHPEKTPRSNR